MTVEAGPATLKRSVGLVTLTFYGLGNIMGAGIYVLLGPMAEHAGMFTPIAFLGAAIVAMFSMLTYAELTARFPVSAGEAVYVQEGLRIAPLSLLVGLLVTASGIVASAAIIRGVYGYIQLFLDLHYALIVIGLVLTLGLLAIWGIAESAGAAALLTGVEIFGLLLVIWGGGDTLAASPARLGELLPDLQPHTWAAILPATFLAFFAFLGFEDMVKLAEEVKRPTRNLPLAILLALGVSTTLYLLVALVSVLTLEPAQLAASKAPLAEVFRRATGYQGSLLSLIGTLAVFNGALVPMITASRVLYGMAAKGMLWRRLAFIHPRTRTPIISTALVIGMVLVLALWLPVENLAAGTSYLILCVFTLINASLIAIKRREGGDRAGGHYPLWVPIAGLATSVGLLLAQVIG
ncbi:MAG: amino acid permease [Gammaproteobacteria bacterium]|nr:amino acid permease [Gammaproteobacteria bacterium]